MTDVVFFLKAAPTQAAYALPWPNDTKLIAVDPPQSLMCGGSDPRCSSAYSRLYSSLKGQDGRVLPNFVDRYAPGVSVDRITFLGFSAAHGFLNPLATNAEDRAAISAYLLVDATFGGGKSGYVAFAEEAALGQRLLVTATSNTGGDDAWRPVWDEAIARSGRIARRVSAVPPMPEPSGGVQQAGDLWYYRFVNAQGGSELPHWKMGSLLTPILQAHLVPFWGRAAASGAGGRGFDWMSAIFGLLAGLGTLAGVRYIASRKRNEE